MARADDLEPSDNSQGQNSSRPSSVLKGAFPRQKVRRRRETDEHAKRIQARVEEMAEVDMTKVPAVTGKLLWTERCSTH
jgi:hypothetical protein